MEEGNSLGSLAQAARGNQLKSARWTMVFVGVLSLIINAVMIPVVDKQIDAEIVKIQQQGMEADVDQVAALRMLNYAILGVGVGLGMLFIVLGAMVYKFPVFCTVTGLVLYLVSAVGFGLIDPTTLLKGAIVKIIIVVALFRSVKSALAYQAEANATPESVS